MGRSRQALRRKDGLTTMQTLNTTPYTAALPRAVALFIRY